MIDIVIVNWNAGELLNNCVNSIITNSNRNHVSRVIIIDNHSTDTSIENLVKDEKIVIIQNNDNLGFAKACNQGFKMSTAPYVLLLNPDTQLFDSTLDDCLKFMSTRTDVDILGCQLLEDNGEVAKSCARFPTALRMCYDSIGLSKIAPGFFTPATLMVDWDHGEDRFVNQVMGAFMFMRLTIFDKIGYFDERFFVYYEELDFSNRLAEVGGNSYYCTKIRTVHSGRGTTKNVKGFSLFLNLRSKLQYAKKHFSYRSYAVVWLCTFFIEPFSRLFLLVGSFRFKEVKDLFKGYQLLISSLPIP